MCTWELVHGHWDLITCASHRWLKSCQFLGLRGSKATEHQFTGKQAVQSSLSVNRCHQLLINKNQVVFCVYQKSSRSALNTEQTFQCFLNHIIGWLLWFWMHFSLIWFNVFVDITISTFQMCHKEMRNLTVLWDLPVDTLYCTCMYTYSGETHLMQRPADTQLLKSMLDWTYTVAPLDWLLPTHTETHT